MGYKVPIYQPSLSGNEKKYVNECLDSSWISSRGDFIGRFENEFIKYIGSNHAVSVSNGTVALHLALVTLGIGPGDEVIVPSFTYIASVSTICHAGATPVFVDSLYSSWQIDPAQIRKAITSKTRAIMVVHLYGQPCEMDEIVKIAKEFKLFVIEDCAEAFGSEYNGKRVGTFGDIACFSFYGNKTITTGEGGMVVTNDETLWDRAYHLRMHGLAKYREYWHDVLGFNYRMTNICAAIGLAQLEKADEKISAKRKLAQKFMEILKEYPVDFHKEVQGTFHTYWMISILVENRNVREKLREQLKSDSIETRPTFYPVHTMPMFSQKYQKLPVAEDIGWRGINLPSFPTISDEQLELIAASFRKFFKD
ncbi:MAG: DegT/DnrJ/EryC1/StrS aminotransferase family protein [Ignavibacteriales bacterium]|nr:DegT/DnrJ/EryC1/StrS aminotransferase family protein [Ignavibacteriales bacterium]HOJ18057.1 DegT/DnrJ/EryC1/StrS aminotransferase family protein [Ignavibacteriaceae bacterium]HPO56253.1 DegT/DnrJ/EryC1/StrS aminotransferase family protein [Ignavibacteriaceae bacterium]